MQGKVNESARASANCECELRMRNVTVTVTVSGKCKRRDNGQAVRQAGRQAVNACQLHLRGRRQGRPELTGEFPQVISGINICLSPLPLYLSTSLPLPTAATLIGLAWFRLCTVRECARVCVCVCVCVRTTFGSRLRCLAKVCCCCCCRESKHIKLASRSRTSLSAILFYCIFLSLGRGEVRKM